MLETTGENPMFCLSCKCIKTRNMTLMGALCEYCYYYTGPLWNVTDFLKLMGMLNTFIFYFLEVLIVKSTWSIPLWEDSCFAERAGFYVLASCYFLTSNSFLCTEELKEKLKKYVDEVNARKPGFIKVVRHSKQEGLIRSRVSGWRVATAPVVALFDAHVEFNVGWYVSPCIYLIKGPFLSTAYKLLNAVSLAYRWWINILIFLIRIQRWTQSPKMYLCYVTVCIYFSSVSYLLVAITMYLTILENCA